MDVDLVLLDVDCALRKKNTIFKQLLAPKTISTLSSSGFGERKERVVKQRSFSTAFNWRASAVNKTQRSAEDTFKYLADDIMCSVLLGRKSLTDAALHIITLVELSDTREDISSVH